MATRQTKAKEPDEGGAEEITQQLAALLGDDTFNAESLNPALEALYAELGITGGGESTVHVTKLNADGRGAEAHIWRGPPEDYDLERLAKQFGSGDYRVKVYVRIPTGQKVSKGNKVFTWMLSPEEEAKRLAPQSTQAQQTNPVDLARMVAEAVRAAIPQPVQMPDPMAQMRQFAEIMALMRPEPIQAPQHDPMVIMERVLQMQTMMRESMPERDDAPVAGNANTNDLLLGVIKSFGPMFAQVLTANAAGAAGQMQEASQESAPQLTHNPQASAPVATAPQTSLPQGEEDVNFKLKMGLSFLCGQCDSGGLPETYAEVVLDSVPPEDLKTLVENPNAVDALAQFVPKIGTPPYREWFGELIAECKNILNQPEEGEPNV